MAGLDAILETTTAEHPATGFVFTEGPLWHPDGFYYFADVRASVFYRLRLGQAAETVRTGTGEGNGTTFDLEGRLVICEGGNRRLSRWTDDSHSAVLIDRFEGKRLNRPNDVVCKSDGSIWFTDPGLRVPLAERELPTAGVYAVASDGKTRLVAEFEYPNGLAFSPDERVLYVANTRFAQYIHAIDLDSAGNMTGRRIFADMSSPETDGVPDGMKVDQARQRLLHRPRRHLGVRARRCEARHHPHARSPGQPRLWRPRSEDDLLHRPHFGLHIARQGAGPAASVVRSPRKMSRRKPS